METATVYSKFIETKVNQIWPNKETKEKETEKDKEREKDSGKFDVHDGKKRKAEDQNQVSLFCSY